MPDITHLLPSILALLLGSMAFFTALVAPTPRKLLNAENTTQYSHDLFPRFYLWGAAMSAAGLLVALYQRSLTAISLAVVLGGFLYLRQSLIPMITTARDTWLADDTPQSKARFYQLHHRSVLINTGLFLLLGSLMFMR